jgi:glycosyltransferase involved in cell wall biosynthesis
MYAPSWPPSDDANGIVTYASYIIPALRELGHQIYVLSPNVKTCDKYTIDLNDFDEKAQFWQRILYKISPSFTHFSEMSKRLVRAVKYMVDEYGVELLEMEESFGISKAVSDLDLIPVVVRLHGPWFLNGRSSHPTSEDVQRMTRECEAIRSASFVTAPSVYVLDTVINRYSLHGRNKETFDLSCLPNPIEIPKHQWQLSECDRNSLLFVGRFDAIKGGDTVVRAFGELAKTNPSLKLTFVGPDRGINGPNGKIIFFEEYARNVLSADALPRITFKNALLRSEIAALRRKSFITLCASEVEIFGYTALEAMAFGCPVVASSVGGVAEMVNSDQNGLLFNAGDAQQMASAIQSLIDDTDKAARLGSNARSRAETFSARNVANHTADYYSQAIERRIAKRRRQPISEHSHY